MSDIRETIYKEKVIGKNVQDIYQVILINQPKITISTSQV